MSVLMRETKRNVVSPLTLSSIQVLPTLLQHMPLKEDMEEVPTVYGCLLHLFSTNNSVVCRNCIARVVELHSTRA